jgi:hypothetical protein
MPQVLLAYLRNPHNVVPTLLRGTSRTSKRPRMKEQGKTVRLMLYPTGIPCIVLAGRASPTQSRRFIAERNLARAGVEPEPAEGKLEVYGVPSGRQFIPHRCKIKLEPVHLTYLSDITPPDFWQKCPRRQAVQPNGRIRHAYARIRTKPVCSRLFLLSVQNTREIENSYGENQNQKMFI